MSAYVRHYAEDQGWGVHSDAAHNLLIRKPAADGQEGRPGIVIQGHLDMVAEKEPGSAHDFLMDPIRLVREGDVLHADGTTLGADNGMGVSIGLAILDSDAAHPPLELLLTTGEETGLTGAQALTPGLVQASYLLNLDVEQEGVFVTSSAGGATVDVTFDDLASIDVADAYELHVAGLLGGHSGLDIDKGRHNALLEIAGLLSSSDGRVLIGHVDAPGKFNAISREARVVFTYVGDGLTEAVDALRGRLAAEPDAVVTLDTLGDARCFTPQDSASVLRFLTEVPNGVNTLAPALGIVESSLNVGVATTSDASLTVTLSIRSSAADALAGPLQQVESLASSVGARTRVYGGYPAWAHLEDNPLERHAVACYEQLFGRTPTVTGVHGGLECGILSDKYPGLAMLSLGVDLHDAHTPRERVSIASVERLLTLTTSIVETIK